MQSRLDREWMRGLGFRGEKTVAVRGAFEKSTVHGTLEASSREMRGNAGARSGHAPIGHHR